MQSAGTYQTTPPSLTNGQVAALQLDSAGNLKVTGAGAGSGTVSLAPANQAAGQVTAGAAAATLVIARATRSSVLIRNTDAANSVYIGPATVTALNGMVLRAGESVAIDTQGLIQVIAPAGAPVVAFYDTYN